MRASAHKQESVAGVVFIVIGRGVVTAGPHGKAGESLTLNFGNQLFECLSVRLPRMRRLAPAVPEEPL